MLNGSGRLGTGRLVLWEAGHREVVYWEAVTMLNGTGRLGTGKLEGWVLGGWVWGGCILGGCYNSQWYWEAGH